MSFQKYIVSKIKQRLKHFLNQCNSPLSLWIATQYEAMNQLPLHRISWVTPVLHTAAETWFLLVWGLNLYIWQVHDTVQPKATASSALSNRQVTCMFPSWRRNYTILQPFSKRQEQSQEIKGLSQEFRDHHILQKVVKSRETSLAVQINICIGYLNVLILQQKPHYK